MGTNLTGVFQNINNQLAPKMAAPPA
jgi:hypothetical protein